MLHYHGDPVVCYQPVLGFYGNNEMFGHEMNPQKWRHFQSVLKMTDSTTNQPLVRDINLATVNNSKFRHVGVDKDRHWAGWSQRYFPWILRPDMY